MKQIGFFFSDEDIEKLDDLCKFYQKNRSETFRQLIRNDHEILLSGSDSTSTINVINKEIDTI